MPGERSFRRRGGWAVPTALAAALAAAFWQVKDHGFVNLDDAEYVYRNAQVLRGLTWPGVAWAFGGFHVANWHPLTWLSHMLDVEVFGPRPGWHHVVNLLLHVANTLILFSALHAATGRRWRSAAVAALFGVHPLHVESVAWISERKDVLSTLFLLLTLAAYARWARTRRPRAYAASLVSFAIGLLCKPMLVTTPLLLLLLDVWPLGRTRTHGSSGTRSPMAFLVVEKVPFLVLAAGSAVVTYLAQSAAGATGAAIPAWPRIANALESYVAYLRQMVWPASLASFYPHPFFVQPEPSLSAAVGAACVLAAITAIAFHDRERRPYLAFGWLWYVVTLLPVIGFLQVGAQARADRYTYVPLVGCFVAVVWGAADLLQRLRAPRWAAFASAGTVVAALAVVASRQTSHWRDSIALHSHAVAVVDRNWKSWQGLCDAYSAAGRQREALAACREAIAILPSFPEAWDTLGIVHGLLGHPEQAIPCFREALRLRPRYFLALGNLGAALGNSGDHEQASVYFRRALELRPEDGETWLRLATARLRVGDRRQAIEIYDRLRRLDPERAGALRAGLGL